MGLMIRFSAGEEEIAALLRFLRRRAPQSRLLMAPLAPLPGQQNPRRHRDDRRFRRTPRPLLRRLATDTNPTRWGLYTALDEPVSAERNGDEGCLLLLQLSAADSSGRRDVLLEARDELAGDPVDLTPRAELVRSLVERSARRLRRRGQLQKGRWYIPF
jgi:hypothetical protein